MREEDLVALLVGGVEGGSATVWAELGSGTGNFTLALAGILGSGSRIISIDRDGWALRRQAARLGQAEGNAGIELVQADFTQRLQISGLDGVLMANSLHFQRDKAPVLALVASYLRPGGRLLVVEYDTDHGNPWVPYPLSFPTWARVAESSGFVGTRRLAGYRGRLGGGMYSALSLRP